MTLVYARGDQTLVDVNQYLLTPSQPSTINMLSQPQLGQVLIQQIYDSFQVHSMPERFQAIICYFSSPSLNYLHIRNSPDFEQIFFDCISQWQTLVTIHNGHQQTLSGGEGHCCCYHPIENLSLSRIPPTEMCC